VDTEDEPETEWEEATNKRINNIHRKQQMREVIRNEEASLQKLRKSRQEMEDMDRDLETLRNEVTSGNHVQFQRQYSSDGFRSRNKQAIS